MHLCALSECEMQDKNKGQHPFSVKYVLSGDLWPLSLFTFPSVHLALSLPLSHLILTLCPSHRSVLPLSSSHLAKVISCCVERDWHCVEYTKQCRGKVHKQRSSPEFTTCTGGRTQTELEMRRDKTRLEHKGEKKKQRKRQWLAWQRQVYISHFSLWMHISAVSLSTSSPSLPRICKIMIFLS